MGMLEFLREAETTGSDRLRFSYRLTHALFAGRNSLCAGHEVTG